MKPIINILFTVVFLSCTNKLILPSFFEGQCYESAKGHLFTGNRICFYADQKYKYIGHGPSVFVSEGNWKYEKSKNEIELTSIAPINKDALKNTVDTMWLDLTGKKIKVKNHNQFFFEEILYKSK